MPVFSLMVNGRCRPLVQASGGAGHVPSAASSSGNANIVSIPKTRASPATK